MDNSRARNIPHKLRSTLSLSFEVESLRGLLIPFFKKMYVCRLYALCGLLRCNLLLLVSFYCVKIVSVVVCEMIKV